MKRLPHQVGTAGEQIGGNLAAWRKLRQLTAQEVADQAGISRGTLRKVERGELGVSLESVLRVMRVLSLLDPVVESLDPFRTPFGIERAKFALAKRVRP